MTKVTVGQLLDLLDKNRESEEIVNIMDNNGNAKQWFARKFGTD